MRFEYFPNGRFVEHSICLSAGGSNGRPFAGIENPKLDAGSVRRPRHCTSERINLFDKMALAYAAYRRVAGHLTQRFNTVGNQQRIGPSTSRGKSRFGTGMPTAHHDDVVFQSVAHSHVYLLIFRGGEVYSDLA